MMKWSSVWYGLGTSCLMLLKVVSVCMAHKVFYTFVSDMYICLQCFDTVGWAAFGRQEGHPAGKKWHRGGGHWLVQMEWRPAGWSVCLPLLIFPCNIKSRSSLLAPAHPGDPGKRSVKRLWWWWYICPHCQNNSNCTFIPLIVMHINIIVP